VNLVIRITRKQRLPVRTPHQTHTIRLLTLLPLLHILRFQLINLTLLLEIKNRDRRCSGSAQPVSIRGEDERVNFVAGLQGVEVFGFVKVPEHGGAVFAAGSAEGTVGGYGYGVDVAGVAYVVGLDAAGSEFPDLMINISTNDIAGG
jgi:hypothetical protein